MGTPSPSSVPPYRRLARFSSLRPSTVLSNGSKSLLGRLLDTLWHHLPKRLIQKLARHPAAATSLVGAATFFAAAIVGILIGLPEPQFHDEFVYLLQADTFSSGRLTNPTHAEWPHFETYHVIQTPSYSGKYPPAQGLVLALGQVLGHSSIGVWLSAGLMAAATVWMLFAWVPGTWAIMSGLFLSFQLGIASYWAQSYWGGAVAAAGGALVYGGLRRLVDQPRLRDGLLFGIGLGVLANCRPLEGLLVSAPAILVLGWRFLRYRQRSLLLRGIVPALVVALIAVAGTAYYNQRTTGSALTFPYQVHERQYASIPLLLWQSPPEPKEYRHPEMMEFWTDWELALFEEARATDTWWRVALNKLFFLLVFIVGSGLFVFVVMPRIIKDRWILFAILVVSLSLISVLSTRASFPHYLAPAAPLFYVIVARGLTVLHQRPPSWIRGSHWILLIAFFYPLSTAVQAVRTSVRTPTRMSLERSTVRNCLRSLPGKDLVVVRYTSEHDYNEEWVYNRADIDAAEIVWARDIGEMENRSLFEYFQSRNTWLLTVGRRVQGLEFVRGTAGTGREAASLCKVGIS